MYVCPVHFSSFIFSEFFFFSGTNAQGQTVTTVIATTETIAATAAAGSHSSSSSSNTGAIVGGVVGGVVGLALLVLIAWFWRRKSRKDDFDGNFDPDRVVRHSGHGPIDLADAPEVTPYAYNPAQPQTALGGPAAAENGTAMRQHQDGKSSLLTAGIAGAGAGAAYGRSPPHSASHYAPPSNSDPSEYPRSDASSHYPPTSPTGSAFPYGDYRHPSPGPSLPTTHSSTGNTSSAPAPGAWQNPRSAKEREALGERFGQMAPGGPGGFVLANHGEEAAGTSGSGVVQHRDGGRAPEDVPNEIPPSYDSIPAGAR